MAAPRCSRKNIIFMITLLILLSLVWLFLSHITLQLRETKNTNNIFEEPTIHHPLITKPPKKPKTPILKKSKQPIKIVDHQVETKSENSQTQTTSLWTSPPTIDLDVVISTHIDMLPLQKTLDSLNRQFCDGSSQSFTVVVNVIIASTREAIVPKSYFCEHFQVATQIRYDPGKRSKSSVSDLELFNFGAQYAKGKYVLFLGRDSYLKTNEIFTMISILEKGLGYSAVGSKVINSKREIISAGVEVGLKWDDFPVMYPRHAGLAEKYAPDVDEDVLCVSPNGMLLKLTDFVPFDYLGTLYSLQYQDRCLKLIKAGKKILYHPASVVIKTGVRVRGVVSDKLESRQRAEFRRDWEDFLVPIVKKRYELNPKLQIAWDFGGGGCSGWFNEATNFVTALENRIPLKVITGKADYCKGLPIAVKESLNRMHSRDFSKNISIWISHKPPPNFPRFPYGGIVSHDLEPDYVIGRSMYESTRIEKAWIKPGNERADEIWVPSKFLIKAFIDSGIDKAKVRWMPEPINVHFYNPEITKPLVIKGKKDYNFLAVFKWEDRKGPDFLFRAFFEEFKPTESVSLFILTYIFGGYGNPHSKSAINDEVMAIVKEYKFDPGKIPSYRILNQVIPSKDMPRLYKSFDAFVLPTRGEGWGLPYMEAMTMGLPTIGTNWGGQLDFMNNNNSYLIDVEAMDKMKNQPQEVEDGKAEPLRYARPSVKHLRKLMRFLVENPEKGRQKGKLAREWIVNNFSQEKLGDMVIKRLKEVEKIIVDQKKTGKKTRKWEAELRKEDDAPLYSGDSSGDSWGYSNEFEKLLQKGREQQEKEEKAKEEAKKASTTVTESAINGKESVSLSSKKSETSEGSASASKEQLGSKIGDPVVVPPKQSVDVKKELETRSNLSFEDSTVEKPKKTVKNDVGSASDKKITKKNDLIKEKPLKKSKKEKKKPSKKPTEKPRKVDLLSKKTKTTRELERLLDRQIQSDMKKQKTVSPPKKHRKKNDFEAQLDEW